MSGGRKQCNQRKNHSSQEKNVKDQLWLRFQITRRRINNISCFEKRKWFFKLFSFHRSILETSNFFPKISYVFNANVTNSI